MDDHRIQARSQGNKNVPIGIFSNGTFSTKVVPMLSVSAAENVATRGETAAVRAGAVKRGLLDVAEGVTRVTAGLNGVVRDARWGAVGRKASWPAFAERNLDPRRGGDSGARGMGQEHEHCAKAGGRENDGNGGDDGGSDHGLATDDGGGGDNGQRAAFTKMALTENALKDHRELEGNGWDSDEGVDHFGFRGVKRRRIERWLEGVGQPRGPPATRESVQPDQTKQVAYRQPDLPDPNAVMREVFLETAQIFEELMSLNGQICQKLVVIGDIYLRRRSSKR